MTTSYRVPVGPACAEIEIARSRFIASLERAPTADDARAFIQQIRHEYVGANHHVYAFRAGFPPSVTEGMSDDGEPTGTGGPPVLAVLRGSGAGDLAIVVTRYFGGTKLGTGGLVRAYTEAAQAALAAAAFEMKRDFAVVGLELPYPLYELGKRAIEAHGAAILDQTFAAEVTLTIRLERDRVAPLGDALRELSAGAVEPVELA